jgi:hypothetical protein
MPLPAPVTLEVGAVEHPDIGAARQGDLDNIARTAMAQIGMDELARHYRAGCLASGAARDAAHLPKPHLSKNPAFLLGSEAIPIVLGDTPPALRRGLFAPRRGQRMAFESLLL